MGRMGHGSLCMTHLQLWHKVLAHSEELLRDINAWYDLKCFSEEGSDACNKLVLKYREHLTRKTYIEDNIVDIFVRLASESDPHLVEFRSKLICDRCGENGHTRGTKCCNYDYILADKSVESFVQLYYGTIIVKFS